MKSLKNKKGFTIVELVIVIAVIAILAAVLIPTFSNVVEKAKESAALQNAKNAYTEYVADTYASKGSPETKIWVSVDNVNIKITDGNVSIASEETIPEGYIEFTYQAGKITKKS